MKKFNKNKIYLLTGLVVTAVLFFSSCKKFYDPPLIFEQGEESVIPKKRKVMVIVAEGATSDAVKTIMPTNIAQLLEHAKYSWNAVSDANTTDPGSWIGITSGKSTGPFGNVDSLMVPPSDPDDQDGHVEVSYIPNYSQRLLSTGKVGSATSKMVVVSPWETLLNVPFKFADKKIFAPDDSAVKDSTVAALADPYVTHLVVDLNGANLAGREHGFSPTNAAYKDAVNTVDGYIGDIMDALKARPTYDEEDWLVIVTTTHGVKPDEIGYGGATIPERTVFAIYYNDNITSQEMVSPALTSVLNVNGKNDAIAMPSGVATPTYDIEAGGEYTIMFHIRNISKSGSNTTLLSKASHAYSNVRGWEFMLEGASKNYRFILGNGTGGNTPKFFIGAQASQASSDLNVWDAIALRIYDSASSRYARMYTNGQGSSIVDMTDVDVASPSNDLVIGNIGSSLGASNAIISNFSFWNTALSEEEILNFSCASAISSSHPQYDHLVGYWPIDEGEGKVIKNHAPGAIGKDFSFNAFGGRTWSLVDQPCAASEDSFMITSMDIVPTIFYWLNATIADTWGFEGKAWLEDFETEFVTQ